MKLFQKVIDLSHTTDEHVPVWPGSKRFEKTLVHDYETDGCRVFNYHQCEGVGTHMDAPAHFIKGGRMIDQLDANELVLPACVIDIRPAVQNNPDYALSLADVKKWQAAHGHIPTNAIILMLSGWSQYWPDEKQYRNMDAQGVMHFPGFSPEAAHYLVDQNIKAVGVDTFSTDPGVATDYPVHDIFLGNDIYQLENVTNLDKIPAVGAWVVALPTKIKDGPEAPTRVIALTPVMD